ncbi:hypothetical protein [Halorubrum sp. DTA98]|uniref:hypothetical protein n=1 Tax=Halorubrum sp. DTA98 TaxID=3402163 RepID=UPI003AAF6A2C
MTVTLPRDVVRRYRRFSRFNSPYPAHDRSRAIDLYPSSNDGLSPVTGTVRETRTVGCPDRPYAASTDHLIVIDLADEWCRRIGAEPGTTARVLHVIPDVVPGDDVSVGDVLGPMTRSGFFGRWVDNHVHLGFRAPGTSALRASGSLPVAVDVDVEPIRWDGTGSVVVCGPSSVVLDAPEHPDPGGAFAAIASDDGVPLDGGLAHYGGGGTFGRDGGRDGEGVSLLGTRVGTLRASTIEWDPIDVFANGRRVTGLSMFAASDGGYGAKLVDPDGDLTVGDRVRVTIRESDDPIRLSVG